MDTTLLGVADMEGYFEIEVPYQTRELLLGYVGMEWTTVKLEENCDNIEMIIMNAVIYDFMTIEKINKKRCKRFKNLPKVHSKANEQGLFETKEPCVHYIFKKW